MGLFPPCDIPASRNQDFINFASSKKHLSNMWIEGRLLTFMLITTTTFINLAIIGLKEDCYRKEEIDNDD